MTKIAELEAQVQELTAANAKLTEEKAAVALELQAAKDANAPLQSQLTTAQADLASRDAQITQLKTDHAAALETAKTEAHAAGVTAGIEQAKKDNYAAGFEAGKLEAVKAAATGEGTSPAKVATEPETPEAKRSMLPTGLAKFAAGLRLPGRKV